MDALEVMAQQGKFKLLETTFHSLVTKGYAAHIAQVSEGMSLCECKANIFLKWTLKVTKRFALCPVKLKFDYSL